MTQVEVEAKYPKVLSRGPADVKGVTREVIRRATEDETQQCEVSPTTKEWRPMTELAQRLSEWEPFSA